MTANNSASDPQQNIGVSWRGNRCHDFRGYILEAEPYRPQGYSERPRPDGVFVWRVRSEHPYAVRAEGEAPDLENARRCAVAIALLFTQAGAENVGKPAPERLLCGCWSYLVVPMLVFSPHTAKCPIVGLRQ